MNLSIIESLFHFGAVGAGELGIAPRRTLKIHHLISPPPELYHFPSTPQPFPQNINKDSKYRFNSPTYVVRESLSRTVDRLSRPKPQISKLQALKLQKWPDSDSMRVSERVVDRIRGVRLRGHPACLPATVPHFLMRFPPNVALRNGYRLAPMQLI